MTLVWMEGIYNMNDDIVKKVNHAKSKINKGDNVFSTGHVISVQEFIVEVSGLDDVSFYESVNIANKAKGYVFGIYYNKVVVAIASRDAEIKVGDGVLAEGHEFKCSFSLDAIGKVIDIFGHDLIAGKTFDNLIDLADFWNDVYDQNVERFSSDVLKRLYVLNWNVDKALLTKPQLRLK